VDNLRDAGEASSRIVTVGAIGTGSTTQSNYRDLSLKVATAVKHGTRRSDTEVDHHRAQYQGRGRLTRQADRRCQGNSDDPENRRANGFVDDDG
jgi:hypothetical protein